MMAKDYIDGGRNSYGDGIEDQEMIKKDINAVKAYIAENDPSMDDAVENMAKKNLLRSQHEKFTTMTAWQECHMTW